MNTKGLDQRRNPLNLAGFFMVILTLFLGGAAGAAASAINFSTPGNYTWKCPTGVSSITVECWGGGGGGGGCNGNYTVAGGGAGGSYVKYAFNVSAGITYNLTVGTNGAAGSASVNSGSGGTGGSSYFGNPTAGTTNGASICAVGGPGGNGSSGTAGTSGSRTGGASGGQATTSGNMPGSGAAANNQGTSGGTSVTGGSGAAQSGAGGAGAGLSGSAGGGAGGASVTANATPGNPGTAPGGGGSGGNKSTADQPGGAGGAGQVTITANVGALAPGNIVVERVGDGSASLTSGATPVFLDEFTPLGSAVQSVPMPQASTRPTSTPFNLMDSGSAASDGQLTRSANGAVIQLPGYNGISGDASIVNSDGVSIPRVIAVLGASASVDTSRTMNAYTNGNNFRSVVSVDGSAFWCAGANGSASSSSLQGIVYYTNGIATELVSNVNARCLNIFSNQLFFSTQGGAAGIYAVGTGLPTSGFQTTNLVIGTGGSPDAFQFNPATNICYLADDRSSKGGVFKYSYTGGIWVSNYLFGTNVSISGAFGLAVDWSGANPVIYATTADGKSLIAITDTGSGATPTILATVDGSTKAFRGVALAPKATPAFSGLTSQSINYGTTSVALSGKVSTANLTYPANGETISITINGATQTTIINDATGDFSMAFPTATIPYAATGYTVTYAYAGNNTLLNAATNDTSTTLTVNKATPTFNLVSSANPSGYKNAVNFTANSFAASVSGSVQFITNGANLGGAVTISGNSAGSITTAALPRGTTNVIAAIYSGDANFLPHTNTLTQTVTNHPPVANANIYYRNGMNNWKIATSDLLANASDPDGDTPILVSLGVSTNGVTLNTNSTPGYVQYANLNHVDDQFTYTVADGYGGTNTATITLTFSSNGALTGTNSIAKIVPGIPTTLTAYGVVNFSYIIQRATNMANPVSWVDIQTNTAVNGVITTTDSFSDLGGVAPAQVYYRIKWNN